MLQRTKNPVDSLLQSRYGDKNGLNIVEVNSQPTVVQGLGKASNRTVALNADQLTRCRASAHLIVAPQKQLPGERQRTVDNAYEALSSQGELVLYPCRWKEQDPFTQKSILRKFEYVTQHEFEGADQSLVILRKR